MIVDLNLLKKFNVFYKFSATYLNNLIAAKIRQLEKEQK